MAPVQVRPIIAGDRQVVTRILRDQWGSERQVLRGREFRPAELEGFLAIEDEEPIGLITHLIQGDMCEVMTLNSLSEGRGVGTALIEAVASMASLVGCRRLRVVTTNDNLDALRFYQRRGFRLVELRAGAVEESRATLKPEISELGAFGIPIRDELELERTLD